jgi:protoheme IX farnesyltransferase
VLSLRLRDSRPDDRQAASRLFAFSIFYLFVLFAALLADDTCGPWSSTLPARPVPTLPAG